MSRSLSMLTGLTAVASAVSVGVFSTASPAKAAGVRLVSHDVVTHTGSGVHAVARDYTTVVRVTAVSAAVSRRIAADVSRRAERFTVPPAGVAGPFDLEDKVTLVRADAHYVTVVQHTYWYTGGANGESTVSPLTYSRSTGKLLTVRDFAAAGKLPTLLKVLSARSRAALARQGITPDFFTDGTKPTYANFQSFEPLPTGWRVEFAQEQVADHAHGPVSVLLPWSALRGLVRLPLPS